MGQIDSINGEASQLVYEGLKAGTTVGSGDIDIYGDIGVINAHFYCINAANDLTIHDGGSIGDINCLYTGAETYSSISPVHAHYDITVSAGGSIGNIYADAPNNSGIEAFGMFSSSGGNIDISGQIGNIAADTGLYTEGTIDISGQMGNVTAGTGLYTIGDVVISGIIGDVNAGLDYGILAWPGDIVISGSTGRIYGPYYGIWAYGGGNIVINEKASLTAAGGYSALVPSPNLSGITSYTAEWSDNADGSNPSSGNSYTWNSAHKYVKIQYFTPPSAPTIDNITAPNAVTVGNALMLTEPSITLNGADITAQGWEISADGNTGWTNFDPSTAMTMTHNGQYLRYYATNSAGTGYSPNTVLITVNALVNAQTPSITTQPQGDTVNVGEAVSLSVTAGVTDGGNLTYQWYSNTSDSNSGGLEITDANSSTYSPDTGTEGTTYYYVIVTNTNNDVSGVKTATTTSVAVAVIVIAAPLPTTYTVTFDYNDGATAQTTTQTGTDGRLSALPVPTRSGYTFDGWFTVVTGGTEVTTATVFTGDATIFAQWTLIPIGTVYTVTVNGSYASNTGSGSYAPDATVTIRAGSRSSYSFTGWSASGVTLANVNSADTTFTMPNNDVTVTANWRYVGGYGGYGGGSSSGGSSGWIPRPITTPMPTAAPAPVAKGTLPAAGEITAKKAITVRDDDSTKGKRIGTLPKDAKVTILGFIGNYAVIEWEDGPDGIGYVLSSDIAVAFGAPLDVILTKDGWTYSRGWEKRQYRLATLKKDQKLKVSGRNGKWFWITNEDGTVIWIPASVAKVKTEYKVDAVAWPSE